MARGGLNGRTAAVAAANPFNPFQSRWLGPETLYGLIHIRSKNGPYSLRE